MPGAAGGSDSPSLDAAVSVQQQGNTFNIGAGAIVIFQNGAGVRVDGGSDGNESLMREESGESAQKNGEKDPNAVQVARGPTGPSWAVRPRVLIVDDDAINRALSARFLQLLGCIVDVAVDGASAVDKVNIERYDLVLMDIVMPKMDGVSATGVIRQFDHYTPIISMTCNARPDEVVTYFSSGMNDVLPKPFLKNNLLDLLEKHLEHLTISKKTLRHEYVNRSVGTDAVSADRAEQETQPKPEEMLFKDVAVHETCQVGLVEVIDCLCRRMLYMPLDSLCVVVLGALSEVVPPLEVYLCL